METLSKYKTVIKSLTWTLIAGIVGACLARTIFSSFDLATATIVFFFAARVCKLTLYFFHEKAWLKVDDYNPEAAELVNRLEIAIENLNELKTSCQSGYNHLKESDIGELLETAKAARQSL